MTARKICRVLVGTSLLLLTAACGSDSHSGPPTIHYGQDACADCGMIISEERFASAIVMADSEEAPLLFDDVGCMISYEHQHSIPHAKRYFHDAATHQWLREKEAHLIKSARPTPMGSGIVAFATPSSAQTYDNKNSAPTVHTYEQLLAAKPKSVDSD